MQPAGSAHGKTSSVKLVSTFQHTSAVSLYSISPMREKGSRGRPRKIKWPGSSGLGSVVMPYGSVGLNSRLASEAASLLEKKTSNGLELSATVVYFGSAFRPWSFTVHLSKRGFLEQSTPLVASAVASTKTVCINVVLRNIFFLKRFWQKRVETIQKKPPPKLERNIIQEGTYEIKQSSGMLTKYGRQEEQPISQAFKHFDKLLLSLQWLNMNTKKN